MQEEKSFGEDQKMNMNMEDYAFSTENRDDSPGLSKRRLIKEPF